MKTKIFNHLLIIVSLTFAACSKQAPTDAAEEAAPEVAEPTEASVPKYSAEDFFETTSFGMVGSSAHAFSPDGSTVLISSDGTGVFNAYALPVDGEAAEQLTDSEDNAVFAVSWFPEDERILYTYDSGGNELNHVIVREKDGSSLDLTPGDNLKAAFVGWSDDGQSFYLVTTERDPRSFDVYRYATDGYNREMVFENPGFSVSDVSGDGRWIAMSNPRNAADSDLYVVDLESENPEPVLITEHTGNISHSVIEIAPDNRTLTLQN